MLFNELDEWAFDLEQEFKINPNMKLRNKIIKLHRLRDKHYSEYINKIKSKYGSRRFPSLKYSKKKNLLFATKAS